MYYKRVKELRHLKHRVHFRLPHNHRPYIVIDPPIPGLMKFRSVKRIRLCASLLLHKNLISNCKTIIDGRNFLRQFYTKSSRYIKLKGYQKKRTDSTRSL